jgi:anti-sigma regulatory factor (Ser/Thr protein kinase)
MSHNYLNGGLHQPPGRIGHRRLTLTEVGNAVPVLDLAFDPGALALLRRETRACAIRFGLSHNRAADMVLAIHELAANKIVHGGGAGRLRIWKLAGALQCQVDDGGFMRSTGPSGAPGSAAVNSLPREPGHGLSAVWQLADQAQLLSGPRGTRVIIAFDLSRLVRYVAPLASARTRRHCLNSARYRGP